VDNNQVKMFAQFIYSEIRPYIDAHFEEYLQFLKENYIEDYFDYEIEVKEES